LRTTVEKPRRGDIGCRTYVCVPDRVYGCRRDHMLGSSDGYVERRSLTARVDPAGRRPVRRPVERRVTVTGRTDWVPAEIDTETPSAARLYDYYLGGGYHFEADRRLAQRIYEVFPETPHMARANRAFLRRATEFCAAQGITQFLDIGCGLPSSGAVHEVAQSIDPDNRVVYVDNEPVAVAHGELILEGTDRAGIVRADLRDPASVLDNPVTRGLLDLNRPVALLIVAVMHFVSDDDDPAGLLARYREALAPGSYLAFSHVSGDALPNVDRAIELYRNTQNPIYLRPRADIEAMLAGFELVEPGLVFVPAWRPHCPAEAANAERCSFYGAVGRRA
jgi:SAM-dependent methyltransferase